MADLVQRSDGVTRRADVALRTAGGRSVLLRMPGPAANGDDAEQLGLASPTFSDVELTPAVFRKTNNEATLMVSATAVQGVTGTLAFSSADVLFATALGVVVDSTLYFVTGWTTAQAAAEACAYYLTLRRAEL